MHTLALCVSEKANVSRHLIQTVLKQGKPARRLANKQTYCWVICAITSSIRSLFLLLLLLQFLRYWPQNNVTSFSVLFLNSASVNSTPVFLLFILPNEMNRVFESGVFLLTHASSKKNQIFISTKYLFHNLGQVMLKNTPLSTMGHTRLFCAAIMLVFFPRLNYISSLLQYNIF